MSAKVLERLRDLAPRSPRTLLLAEFPDAKALVEAAGALRGAGVRRFDAHSPWPIEGLERAMGLGESILPWIVLGVGLSTFLGFLAFMAWASLDYPTVHSGKPVLSIWPLIPAAIEVTWMAAGTAALVGFMALAGLPLYYHLAFRSPRFKRASDDGFFISVDGDGPRFDAEATRALLERHGGRVERLDETSAKGEPSHG